MPRKETFPNRTKAVIFGHLRVNRASGAQPRSIRVYKGSKRESKLVAARPLIKSRGDVTLTKVEFHGASEGMQAPTAAELLSDPMIRRALDEAWADSVADDAVLRHEEGGWIYADTTAGAITVRRAQSGGQAMIDLSHPPVVTGSVVVGKFHTHPNPSAEGWEPGPSAADLVIDAQNGVPDLIRADDGVLVSGPDSRRGGMTGEPGYPA